MTREELITKLERLATEQWCESGDKPDNELLREIRVMMLLSAKELRSDSDV